MNPPFPHIQPPLATTLLPWAIKNCPTCVRLTQRVQPPSELAACPFLSSIASSIIWGPTMDPAVLDVIDTSWIEQPRSHFYKLPENCNGFVPIC